MSGHFTGALAYTDDITAISEYVKFVRNMQLSLMLHLMAKGSCSFSGVENVYFVIYIASSGHMLRDNRCMDMDMFVLCLL